MEFLKFEGIPLRGDHPRIDSFTPRTVVMVGNGAIKNGWLPIEQVVRLGALAPDSIFRSFCLDQIPMEKLLVMISNFSRLGRRSLFSEDICSNPEDLQQAIKLIRDSDIFRKSISDAILEFEGHDVSRLELRNFPSSVMEGIHLDNCAFITTNWDTCLWKNELVRNAVYLHGRAGFENSIIFPGESTADSSDWDTILRDCGRMPVLNEYRSFIEAHLGEAIPLIDHVHAVAHSWLLNCRKIIFWGIGLNTYDAEILGLVGLANSDRQGKEVVCINPDGGGGDQSDP